MSTRSRKSAGGERRGSRPTEKEGNGERAREVLAGLRGEGGIINHGWDFIKLRLSCALCIVYYLLLRGGFAHSSEIHRHDPLALSASSRGELPPERIPER